MSKTRSHPAARGAKPSAPVARLPALLLGGLVAVAVGRALLASEAVAWLGDGQPFNMLVLSLAVLTALAAVGSGGFKARWTPTDVAVLLLWLCYSASAVRAAIYASPRLRSTCFGNGRRWRRFIFWCDSWPAPGSSSAPWWGR